MRGPEHYRLAEDWLSEAADAYDRISNPYEAGRLAAALAGVHAQLAGAGAVAELDAYGMADGSATGRSPSRFEEWTRAFDRIGGRSAEGVTAPVGGQVGGDG